MAKEKLIFMVSRDDGNRALTVPGGGIGQCETCKQTVYLSPSTASRMTDDTVEIELLCFECAERDLPKDSTPAKPPKHSDRKYNPLLCNATLRDLFAASALTGLIGYNSKRMAWQNTKEAYGCADAMLDEREKSGGTHGVIREDSKDGV